MLNALSLIDSRASANIDLYVGLYTDDLQGLSAVILVSTTYWFTIILRYIFLIYVYFEQNIFNLDHSKPWDNFQWRTFARFEQRSPAEEDADVGVEGRVDDTLGVVVLVVGGTVEAETTVRLAGGVEVVRVGTVRDAAVLSLRDGTRSHCKNCTSRGLVKGVWHRGHVEAIEGGGSWVRAPAGAL